MTINPDTGSAFTTVVVKETKVKQDIPTVWLDDAEMMRPFSLLPSDKGEPSEKWSKADLEAHAAANGVEVAPGANKADILAAINATAGA